MDKITFFPATPREAELEQELRYEKDLNAVLYERVHQQETAIAALKEQLAQKDVRIGELERRLKLNSTNSSKPPSSDFLTHPSPRGPKQKTGAKKGPPGKTLKDYGVPIGSSILSRAIAILVVLTWRAYRYCLGDVTKWRSCGRLRSRSLNSITNCVSAPIVEARLRLPIQRRSFPALVLAHG